MVRIRAHSSLNCYLPEENRGKTINLGPSEASDLQKVLEKLQIPEDAVTIVLVNNKNIGLSSFKNFILSDGDEVQLFPVISGG